MLSNVMRKALSFITSVVLIFASITLSVELMTEDVFALSAFSQIEAENFNASTSSISTFTSGNSTIAGNIVNGNYMAYYNVDFGSGTNYFKAKVATNSYTTIQIRTDSISGNLLGTLNVNSTGDFDTYQELSCGIGNATGTNNVYLVFGGPVNIDWFSFNPVSTPTPTATSTSTATPSPTSTVAATPYQTSSTTSSSEVKIEAENHNGGTSSISNISYGTYGNAAGNISKGNNLSYYDINLGNGITSFKAKVATTSATTIEVRTGSVYGNLLCTLNVNSTGSLDSFQEMSCSASGASGINNIFLVFGGPMNIDCFSFTLSSTAIATAAPTQIIKTTTTYTPVYVSSSEIKFEAENYNEGTSSISTINSGDATIVGNIVSGNNLGYYNINFGNGITSFKAKVATNSYATIQVRTGSPSGNILGTLNVNSTGSYNTFQEISCGIGSTTGINNVYLVFSGPINIDWFTFNVVPTSTPTTAPTASSTAISSRSAFNQIEAESYNSLNGSTINLLSLSSGGYCLGYNSSYKDGSYATFNNINFGNGATLFKAMVATTSATSIEIRAGSPSGTILGNLSVPSTGSFHTFQEMTCSISSITGYTDIYIIFSEAVYIDWFTFAASSTPTATATATPTSVPITNAFSQIQAENCTSFSAASIMAFGISNGGTALGYINSGNYIVFNNLDFGTGASSFKARVATANDISIEIRKGSSTGTLIGTLSITSTGSADTYHEMTCSVSNVTGVNDICFVFSGNVNFDWFMFKESSSTPAPIINAFTTIQAESYNSVSSDNVQTISVADTGGNAIGYIESNNYVVFNNVNFGTGAASFKAKVASASGSTSDIQVRLGSSTGTLLGTLSAPSLSSWDTYFESTCNIINTSGINDLYLVFTGPINVDWFIFSTTTFTASPTPTTTTVITHTPSTTATTTPSTTPSATPSTEPTSTVVVSSTPIKLDQPSMFISRTAPPSVKIATNQTISSIQKGELDLNGIGTLKSGAKRDIVLLVDNAVSTDTVTTDVVSPLDFGIFAYKNIRAVGNETYIKGNVHANDTLESYVANCTVTGISSASKFKIGYGSMYSSEMKTITSPLPMPAFHTNLIDEANTTIIKDTTVTPTQQIHWVFEPATSDYSKPFPGQTGFNLRYEKSSNTFVITGEGTFNLTSTMYFKGNVRISVPHIVNTGSSFLVADGFVNLEGNSMNSAELDENAINNNTNLLNVYSIHGRILVTTINCKIYGTLYAAGIPNPLYPDDVGVVILQGINTDIYGSIVAGSDIRIESSFSNYYSTPVTSKIAETKYLRSDTEIDSKEAAKQVVEAFRGPNTRMCALQYSEVLNSANDFTFYSLSNDDEVASLKGNVIDAFPLNTNGFSNMGDALRHAYYLLNESPSDTTKYIIVLASNAPNKWTSDDSTYTSMKTTIGDANFVAGDGTVDADENSLNYAIEIAKKIKTSGINTVYINNSQKDISANLEKIASTSEALKDSTTNKNYFTTTSLPNFSPIYKTVFMDTPDSAVLRMDEYVEILPTGVKAIIDPSSYDIDDVQVDGVTRQRVRIKSLELQLRYDGTKYLIENYNTNIKIRMLKLGSITLDGSDSKYTYSIDFIDPNGETKTATFIKNPNDVTLNVTMDIDIQ